MQQVRIDLGAEYGIGQLNFADFFSVQIDYIHDWHNLDSFFCYSNPLFLCALTSPGATS
jgi:hypothetical protein